jgi:hypothetical protein
MSAIRAVVSADGFDLPAVECLACGIVELAAKDNSVAVLCRHLRARPVEG